MAKKIRVNGRLHKPKGKKYYQAILNLPEIGEKWISTKCEQEGRADEKMDDMIDELELRYNHPEVAIKESVFEDKILFLLFPDLDPRDRSDVIKMKNILLIDYLRDWETHFIHIHKTTLEGYRLNFNCHILPYFEKNHPSLKLADAARRHMQAFVNEMAKNGRMDGKGGLDKKSIKIFVSNMSILLDDALMDELIEYNPCTKLRYPKAKNPKMPKLSFDWLLKLLDVLKSETIQVRVGLCLALFYALRRGEIYGLCYSDIKDGQVHIERAYARAAKENIIKEPKNEASRAAMPLMDVLSNLLEELKEYQAMDKELYGEYYDDNDFIFKRPDGKHYGLHYLNDNLQKIIDWNGIPKVTVHGLRRSTASLLRSMGFEVQQIQSWLRHADIDSTELYAEDGIEVRELPAEALSLVFTSRPDNVKHIRTQLVNMEEEKLESVS